jgi:hypothetical protein
LAIQLLPSAKDTDVPLGACTVLLDFLPPSGQRNTIVATAIGTQLNLALLKACNFNETIGMCVIWRFGTSSFRVSNVLFVNPETGSDAGSVVFPKMTQEDANKLK